MPLNYDHEREITQLLFIAKNYLSLGSDARLFANDTLAAAKDCFARGATPSTRARELTIVGAHLSSAAVRLVSIEEVLRGAKVSTLRLNACRDYFGDKGPLQDSEARVRFPDWFYIMLRDNTAHEEPTQELTQELPEVVRRRQIRQEYLESTKFPDAHSNLQGNVDALSTFLRETHRMVLPTFSS